MAAPEMTELSLSGRRKAAILLASLGPDLAALVYKHLSEQEIEQVTVELARTEDVHPDERAAVLGEIVSLTQGQRYIAQGGVAYARTALERAFGASRAVEILDRLTQFMAPRPFDALTSVDPMQLLSFLQGEHPQTMALVLAYLPTDTAAHVLKAIPKEIQADVTKRIATMDRTNPAVVGRVENVLEGKIASLLGGDFSNPGGVDVVVALLNRVDRGTERSITQTLEEEDAELAEAIRQRMFLFEDLAQLDDRFIQRVLRDAEQHDLVLALKGSSDAIAERLLQNMSQRQAELVQDDLKYLGAVRLREVEAAQQRIVALARRLEEEGEIIMSRGIDDEIIA